MLARAGWLTAFILVPTLIAVHARYGLPAGLGYTSSAEEIVQKWGAADPASYVRYGRYLLGQDPWDADTVGCWPPGMGLINAAIFSMTGEDAFVLKTMIVSVLLWGMAFYAVFRSLRSPRSPVARFALVNAIWLFPSFRYGLLITASIFSESKALPLFAAGVAFFVRGLQSGRPRHFVASGLALALAANIRAVFDSTIMIGFTCVALIALGRLAFAWLVATARADGPWSLRELWRFAKAPQSAYDRDMLKRVGILLVTALVLIVPWKLRNLTVLGTFSLRACGGDWVAYWSYDMPSYLTSGDSGCVAAPQLCAILNSRMSAVTPELGRQLTVFTMMSSPRAYFANKLRYFPDFWIGTPWRDVGARNNAFLLEGSISLLAGGIGLLWALRVVGSRGPRGAFAAFFLGFCVQNLLVFSLVHYNHRFSAPIRLFFLLAPWFMASLAADRASSDASCNR